MPVTTFATVNGRILAHKTGVSRLVKYLPDALGSVTCAVSGGTVQTTSYTPYGQGAKPALAKFGWVGGWGYRPTALPLPSHYVRARHYDNVTGSWTSADPIWPEERAYLYVDGRALDLVDPSGTQTPGMPAPRIRECLKSKTKLDCAKCVYTTLHTLYNFGPQRACDWANQICKAHIRCGPCGPGSEGFPTVPSCTDGVGAVRQFLTFLHGEAGRAACGGYQGFDKLAHCYGNCMLTLCAGGFGILACRMQQWGEDDPEDIQANELGRGIAFHSDVAHGEDCLHKCAEAVYGMESW